MTRIDSHHHLWRYTAREYGWIPEPMAMLRRDFLPADLRPELDAAGVDGTVLVQVRQTLEESEWMLALAEATPWIRGVVGWAPLRDPGVRDILSQLAAHRLFKGVRHILQDEPANDLMDDAAFRAGVRAAGECGLVYDLLIYERHLAQALRFVASLPDDLVIVVDHAAKPRIRDGVLDPWRAGIRELARRPRTYCKLSGMATEADWSGWSAADLAPYIQHVIDCFGPSRVMFGSDWPVMLPASGYLRWRDTVASAIAGIDAAGQSRIWGGTAIEAYRLGHAHPQP